MSAPKYSRRRTTGSSSSRCKSNTKCWARESSVKSFCPSVAALHTGSKNVDLLRRQQLDQSDILRLEFDLDRQAREQSVLVDEFASLHGRELTSIRHLKDAAEEERRILMAEKVTTAASLVDSKRLQYENDYMKSMLQIVDCTEDYSEIVSRMASQRAINQTNSAKQFVEDFSKELHAILRQNQSLLIDNKSLSMREKRQSSTTQQVEAIYDDMCTIG